MRISVLPVHRPAKRIQEPFLTALQALRQADLDIRPIRSSLIYDKFSRHCLQTRESHHIMKIASFWLLFADSDPDASPPPAPTQTDGCPILAVILSEAFFSGAESLP
jgi:hypothetical protein